MCNDRGLCWLELWCLSVENVPLYGILCSVSRFVLELGDSVRSKVVVLCWGLRCLCGECATLGDSVGWSYVRVFVENVPR